MTLSDLEAARNAASGKLFRNRDDNQSQPKRRKVEVKPNSFQVQYTATDVRDVAAITSSLQGQVIVIEPGNDKSDLEKIVVRHGGTVEQHPRKRRTNVYVVTAGSVRSKAVIDQGYCDVVKADWLKDCALKFRHLRPSDMIFTTEATKDEFKRRQFDEYGDCDTEYATASSLKYSMGKVKVTGCQFSTDLELSDDYHLNMFRSVVAFVHDSLESHLIKMLIRFYGGRVKKFDEKGVNYVFTGSNDHVESYKEYRRQSLNQGQLFKILRYDFIFKCIAVKRLVNTSEFEL